MKNLKLLLLAIPFMLFACSSDDDDKTDSPKPLGDIQSLSLRAESSSQSISLPRVLVDGAAVLKGGSFWIENIKVNGDRLNFDVLENIYFEKGCRVDTIIINEKGVKVGEVAIAQARNRVSNISMPWATDDATYRNETLDFPDKHDGLKNTIYVYNLEKTTKGKDTYKNYPVFAYCIDMNSDPENNMEWYLPSQSEILELENRDEIFNGHVYWWNSDNFEGYGFPFGVGAGSTKLSKAEKYWVYAFNKNSN